MEEKVTELGEVQSYVYTVQKKVLLDLKTPMSTSIIASTGPVDRLSLGLCHTPVQHDSYRGQRRVFLKFWLVPSVAKRTRRLVATWVEPRHFV